MPQLILSKIKMGKTKKIELLADDVRDGDLVQFQTRGSDPHTGHYIGTSEDGKFLLFGFTRVQESDPSFTIDKYKWHKAPDILLRYDKWHMDVHDYQIIRRAKTKSSHHF